MVFCGFVLIGLFFSCWGLADGKVVLAQENKPGLCSRPGMIWGAWRELLDPFAPCASAMGHLWSPSDITMEKQPLSKCCIGFEHYTNHLSLGAAVWGHSSGKAWLLVINQKGTVGIFLWGKPQQRWSGSQRRGGTISICIFRVL